MAVIKVVELVGSSSAGWDDAARNALKEASETIRSIRGLDVINQTATVKDGAVSEYRTNIRISFVVEDVRD
jgi:flavin-binding protein dodecin